MPVEDTDIILLDWWKNNEYRFPKLAKMAAASSTRLDRRGVERVFSATAGACTTISASR